MLGSQKNLEIWNRLPPELKMMCIEKMDLETRLKLRMTAKNERKMVDSARLTFVVVVYPIYNEETADHEPYGFDCNLESDVGILCPGVEANLLGFERTMALIGYIFKHHDVHEFRIRQFQNSYWQALLYQMVKNGPIRVKHLDLGAGMKVIKTLLENCDPKHIETMYLHNYLKGDFGDCEIEKELGTMPAVFSAECVELYRSCSFQLQNVLVEEWINRDAAIGTRLYIRMNNDEIVARFSYQFQHLIVSNDDEDVRIRTNNPEKHIVINRNFSRFSFIFIVISASTKHEKEYEHFLKSDYGYSPAFVRNT